MRILIDSPAGTGLAARFLALGHQVMLGFDAPDLARRVAALRQVLGALSDLPLAPEGEAIFTHHMKIAPQDYDLAFNCPEGTSGVAVLSLPGPPLQIQVADPEGRLPFVAADHPTPAQTDALQAAGFITASAADMQVAAGLLQAVAGFEGASQDLALSAMMRSLRDRGLGPGAALLAQERAAPVPSHTPAVVSLQVLPSWIDYNGHMTESRYLYACSEVTDNFLRRIGAGLDYVATGYSYYTAETHLRHLRECRLGDRLEGHVQILGLAPKRLHLAIVLREGGAEVATLEQMLIHVDMARARACEAPAALLARAQAIADAAALPRPAWAGRAIRG